jgi:filamentous hemagglutinin family protein
MVSSELFALPEGEQAAAGQVDFSRDGSSLKITASDKAIINYQKFNIGEAEHVQFIQPSSKASVLNRIKSGNPSKILGKLTANGRVYLVNPSGIYFGPHATVNTGSFVASTLNIGDEDFLNGKLHFSHEPGSEKATIVNEGMISASPEGFVALFAPFIENRGSILAQAGKVILAAAERVTLDFTGDGLIQFSVDGDLKEALIENYGKIEAAGGAVEISLNVAKKAIKMVVNTDGITPANDIEEADGIIRLVNTGTLLANTVHVDGSRIDVQGAIDVSSENAQGGTAHLLGDQIQLRGVKINASGALGGGNVFVGGDYQGKGELRTAQNTVMDAASQIDADAYQIGDGGKVILWSDDTTLFDGKIYARGGDKGGNGGFVETSGKMELGIQTGHVDTSATQGKFGNWLLDPSSITIATGGGATIAACSSPNCADNTTQSIDPATIGASATNVALCAQNSTSSSITVTNAVTMANPGVSLTLTAGSTNVGTINLNNNITTKGGAINLNGVVALGANATLDTTSAGTTPAGAAISLSNSVNGARTLNLNGGTGGTVTMAGSVGGTTTLTSLTATGATVTQSSTTRTTGAISFTGTTAINLGGNIRTSGAVTFTGPVIPSGTPLIDTTNNGGTAVGANISFSSTINGATSLTFRAGTAGIVTFSGAVGNTTPLTNLIFTSANLVRIANNITVTGGSSLVFSTPVSLTGTSNITSNNANTTFSSTLNGAQALTLTGGSGTVTFTGAVGGTAPLTNIVFTSANLIQIGNSITVSGANPLLFPSPVSLTGTSSINSNNANITFNSTLNGAQAFTVAGGSGTTTFTGAVGGTTPLTSLSATAATITQSSTAKTTGALSYTGSTAINVPNNITTSGGIVTMTGPVSVSGNPTIDTTNGGGTAAGANISFSGTLNGATALTLRAGTGGNAIFSGAVGNTAPLTNLVFTSANLIQIGNNITVSGANPLVFPSPVSLTGTSTINSNNANITFNSTLNGAQVFTVTGGSGTTTFTGAVGGTTPLASLSATAATITQSSTAKTTGALSYTGSTAINLGSNITTSGGIITLTGPVTLNGNVVADTTNSSGTPAGANITLTSTVTGGNSLSLIGGTVGTVSFGTVDGVTPPTSLTASGSTINQNSTVKTTGAVSYTGSTAINVPNNITTCGGIVTMAGPVAISNNPTIDTTDAGGTPAGANISFSGSLNGATALTLLAGTGGNITLSAATGNTAPLTDILFTSANLIQIGNNITVTGANPLVFPSPVSLTGTSIINSNNALITFNSTLDGAQALTLTGGSGTTTFTGAVGGTTPLSSLSATAATITQTSAAKTTGALSYTGSTAINLGSNITTSGGIITLTGPATLNGNVTADTTNSGGTPAGANITLTSTVNGANSLTLTGGTGGTISFGTIGGTTPLTSLTASGSTINQNSTVKTTGAVSYTGSTAVNIPSNITTSGGVVTMTGPVTVSGTPTIDSTNGGGTAAGANISFSSTLNGATALTLRAGTGGNVTFAGAVGNTAPLTNLVFTSANLIQIGNNITVSGGNPLLFPSPCQFDGTECYHF